MKSSATNRELHTENENCTLSMKERIGYGVGDFASNMMYAPLHSFVSFFLTDIAGIGAGIVGTIMLVSRLLDGGSDLVVGVLMEKIRSKHGKARPWLLWWCVPYAISLILLFTAPDFSMTGKIIYAFLVYNLAATVTFTAINLPFGALAAMMTRNQRERGYLNVSKMFFAYVGQLLVNVATLPLVAYFGNDKRAWQITFCIYGLLSVIFFLITFFSTKERVRDENAEKGEKTNIKRALKSLVKNKYWLILVAVFFLFNFGKALIGVNVYYAKYVMNDDSIVGTLSFFQIGASLVTFLCTAQLLKMMNKQKIAMLGVIISFIGYAMVLFAPTSYAMLYISSVVKGVGNAALCGVMYGMLADTVEYNEWKSGIRAEGLVFSANSIGIKIGTGLGAAALGWILAFFGYVSSGAAQPASAVFGVKVMFLYVPLAVYGILAVVMRFYKLDEEYDQVVKELADRKRGN